MGKEHRGFASMDRTKQREIASQGGKAAHQKGTAREWTTEEARQTGRKGGLSSRGGRGKLANVSDERINAHSETTLAVTAPALPNEQ